MVAAEIGVVAGGELKSVGEGADAGGKVGLVDGVGHGDVGGFVTDIAGLESEGRGDLALIIERPLHVLGVLEAGEGGDDAGGEDGGAGERGELFVRERELEAVLIDVGLAVGGAEGDAGIDVMRAGESAEAEGAIGHAKPGADDVAAFGVECPGESDAGGEVVAVGFVSLALRPETDGDLEGTGDAIGVVEGIRGVPVDAVVFPAEAEIENEVGADAKIVLEEEACFPCFAAIVGGAVGDADRGGAVGKKGGEVGIGEEGDFFVEAAGGAMEVHAAELEDVLAVDAEHGLFDGPGVTVVFQAFGAEGEGALEGDDGHSIEVVNAFDADGVIEIEAEAGFAGPGGRGAGESGGAGFVEADEIAGVGGDDGGDVLGGAAAAIAEGGLVGVVEAVIDAGDGVVVGGTVGAGPAVDSGEGVGGVGFVGVGPEGEGVFIGGDGGDGLCFEFRGGDLAGQVNEGALAVPFVNAEEEEAVLDDGSAEGAAELVEADGRFGLVGGEEGVAGV